MKSIFLIFILTFLLTGCSAADYFSDFENNVLHPMTFEVRQVDYEDLVASSEEMQLRQELVASEEEPSETEDSLSEDVILKVNTDLLNVRAGADAESEKIGELVLGDNIDPIEEVSDEQGNLWVKFDYNGSEGYVLADYLTSQKVEEPIGTYRVVIHGVNVRSGPSEESEVLGEFAYFEDFPVYNMVEDENGKVWLETRYGGQDAFVISDYCIEVN